MARFFPNNLHSNLSGGHWLPNFDALRWPPGGATVAVFAICAEGETATGGTLLGALEAPIVALVALVALFSG
jgi:hypothetical protein